MCQPLIAPYCLLLAGVAIVLLMTGCRATVPPQERTDTYIRATSSPRSAAALDVTPSPSEHVSVSPQPLQPSTPTRTPDVPSSVFPTPLRVETTPLPTRVLPPQPAPNFAFTFGYGSCAPIKRVVNTFNDTLTQQPPGEEPVTIPFKLTNEDKLTIYQKMTAINFWSYPSVFTIPIPDNQQMIGVSPYPEYSFTARTGDLSVSVQWADSIYQPTSTDAEHLRELIALLKQTVETHPDLGKLPPLSEACA